MEGAPGGTCSVERPPVIFYRRYSVAVRVTPCALTETGTVAINKHINIERKQKQRHIQHVETLHMHTDTFHASVSDYTAI